MKSWSKKKVSHSLATKLKSNLVQNAAKLYMITLFIQWEVRGLRELRCTHTGNTLYTTATDLVARSARVLDVQACTSTWSQLSATQTKRGQYKKNYSSNTPIHVITVITATEGSSNVHRLFLDLLLAKSDLFTSEQCKYAWEKIFSFLCLIFSHQ